MNHNISITSRVEEAALYFYNGHLSNATKVPLLLPIEKQIFSRIMGLLISPAALVEMAAHISILPFSVIYAIGNALYQKGDFLVPWQHLQRVKDAVFPLFFGTLFGVIHPYMGTYAAEPAKKHIAVGILLSGTDKGHFNTVSSPLTSMSEIFSLLAEIPNVLKISPEEEKLLHYMSFWEAELEKIQAIDFFNLNLTFNIIHNIQKNVDTLNLSPLVKEVAKRISLLTYPLFMIADLFVFVSFTAISLGAWVVKIVGGHAPAYLEQAGSLEVLIYNVMKMPLFMISVTFGFLVSLVDPERGLLCAKYPMKEMARVPFLLKMMKLKFRLRKMQVGESLLLPAVQTWDNQQGGERRFLPSYGSHMRYLLITKVGHKEYQAELIERGPQHGQTKRLSEEEMGEIVQKTLALRYQFGSAEYAVLSEFNDKRFLTDLGTQQTINNCVITNLFAAIQVVHARYARNHFSQICVEIKARALRRYYMYTFDFYPFGSNEEIRVEMDRIFLGNFI